MRPLVHPFCREVCRRKHWDGFELLGPFGLCCRVGIHFIKQDVRVYWLEVSVGDISTGMLRLTDYTKDTGEFPAGSIGARNGMNHPQLDLLPTMPLSRVLSFGHSVEDEREPTETVYRVS